MFCRKCGEQISGNEKFCPKCGAPVVSAQQPGMQGAGRPGGTAAAKKKPPYLAIGLIAVVAIVVIVAVKMLFFSNNYEKPVKNLMKSIEKQDTKLLMSTIPDDVFDVLEEELDMDKDEIVDQLDGMISELADEYDGKIKVEYEIEDVHKLKKSEIKEIEDELYDSVEIKEGKRLEISTVFYVDGEVEEEEDMYLNVIKVGGKWYIDPSSM